MSTAIDPRKGGRAFILAAAAAVALAASVAAATPADARGGRQVAPFGSGPTASADRVKARPGRRQHAEPRVRDFRPKVDRVRARPGSRHYRGQRRQRR